MAKKNFYVEGLLQLIHKTKSMTIVACTDKKKEYINYFKKSEVDFLIVHANIIPDGFFKELKQYNPNLKILIFGQYLSNDVLVNLIRSGASGYINENMCKEHFFHAVEYIMKGNLWVERHILEKLATEAMQIENILERDIIEKINEFKNILTNKETMVFQWILKGLSIRDIGKKIDLSEQSVKLHLTKIFKKAQVTNRINLILEFHKKTSIFSNIDALIQTTLETDHTRT